MRGRTATLVLAAVLVGIFLYRGVGVSLAGHLGGFGGGALMAAILA